MEQAKALPLMFHIEQKEKKDMKATDASVSLYRQPKAMFAGCNSSNISETSS